MIYLRNKAESAEVGVLESPADRVITRHLRSELPVADGSFHGGYADIGGIVLGLYRHQGRLYLYWNGTSIPWDSINGICLDRGPNRRSCLSVRTASQEWSLEYEPIVLDPPLSEVIESQVEEEDYDFCLFLKQVYDSLYRSELVYPAGK